MFRIIPITNRFKVPALLPIENEQFAHCYSRGVFWALYGDYQGNGPYADRYLIDNVARAIANGWYHDLNGDRLRSSGFFLGMIHGGNIDPRTLVYNTAGRLVTLTDADFMSGYESALQTPRAISDEVFMCLLHSYASSCAWTQPLSYALGTIIGTMNHATRHAQAAF
jgi:hypothetical protein